MGRDMRELAISYNILSGAYDPPPDYTIVVPRPAEWLDANGHGPRRVKAAHKAAGRNVPMWKVIAELTGTWRTAAGWAAKAAKIPALGPSRIVAELVLSARRTHNIDPNNWVDTAKPCVDGLVDAGIWPDDNVSWVTGPDMRLAPDRAPSADSEALRLHIWGRSCCDAAGNHHEEEK